MSLGFVFKPEEHDDPMDLGPIPSGDYITSIVSSEVKLTKKYRDGEANSGRSLKICLEICSGGYKGRKFYPTFNIENDSAKAVKIGMSQLKQLCDSCDIKELSEESQLINCIVGVEVLNKTTKDTDGNAAYRYEVIKYKPVSQTRQPVNPPATGGGGSSTPVARRAAPNPFAAIQNQKAPSNIIDDDIPF